MTSGLPGVAWRRLRAGRAYALTLLATSAALGFHLAFDGWLGEQAMLVLFTLPIVFGAYMGGLPGGLLATGLTYFAFPLLHHDLSIASAGEHWPEPVTVLAAVAISAAMEGLHRARRRAGRDGLEHQVADASARQSQQRLRESEERFHQLADHITDAFWIRSPDMSEVHYVSPAFERIWGRPVASLYADPRAWSDYVFADDRARVVAAFAALTRDVPSLDIEYRIVRPEGEIRWVRSRGFQVRNAAGHLIRHTGIVTDITERRRADESIRTQAHILDSIGQAVIATDLDGQVTYANRFAEQLYGWPPGEMVGRPIMSVTGSDTSRLEAEVIVARLERGDNWSGAFHVRRRDGTEFLASVTNTPLRDPSGRMIGIGGISEDITERRLAAQALQTSLEEFRRVNRALEMLSSCNEMLIRAEDEAALLEQACAIAVEHGGYRMAWVGFAQDDAARSIVPLARAGTDDGYVSAIATTWNENDPLGQGPVGQAVRTGRAVVYEDVTQAPSFAPWLALAQREGYRGVICLPLRDATRTFGVLTLYSADVNETSPAEIKLLQDLADDLAFGIGSLRIRSERQRLQAAVVTVAASVSAATGRFFFQQLARYMAEAVGAHGGFVAQLQPGERANARTVAAVVAGRAMDDFDFEITGLPGKSILASDASAVSDRVADHLSGVPETAAAGAQAFAWCRLTSSSREPLGLVFVVFRERLKDFEFVTSTLQIFAARAASELEREQTDARVREQAALLDIANEAILVKDLADRITYWNKGAERTYGWSAAEVLGRSATEFLYADAASLTRPKALLLSTGSWHGELITRTRRGLTITVDARWTLVRDAQGVARSILAINTDITEKKMLASQSLRAQRMEGIGTLAGGIAHDLNNVLAPIVMSIEMLKELIQDQDGLSVLATLQGSAERGARLVQQVVSFARGVEGQRLAVDPVSIVRELIAVMRDTFPKSIDVRFAPGRDLWTVTGDPTQLHQVFLNLFVNARDAMEGGGSLTIGFENIVLGEADVNAHPQSRPGGYVRITVADTGGGIPAGIRDRVFEPFFTTKEVGKGTGLGLSTTLAIVKSHGGFIHLHASDGSGTTFSVYLPANRAPAAADEIVEEDRRPRGRGELILVVDDDQAVRVVARRLLERSGYRVMEARDGAEALSAYSRQQEEVALVLTDMAMPNVDGSALIKRLLLLNPAVRIIASSGFMASTETDASGACAGVRHFLPKPYTAGDVLRALETVLRPSA